MEALNYIILKYPYIVMAIVILLCGVTAYKVGDKNGFYKYLPLVVLLLSILIYNIYMNDLLKKNGKYTIAVIYEFQEVGKYGRNKSFKYKYIVDGVEYQGGGIWYPNRDILSVGDTITIIYNKAYLSHSAPKRDTELNPLRR